MTNTLKIPPPPDKKHLIHYTHKPAYTLTYKSIIVPACAYLVLFIFACAALAPGYIDVDSYGQLFQFLSRTYNDWHPTIFAVSWSFLYAFFGVKGMLIFHLFCYFSAFFLFTLLLYAKYKNAFLCYVPLLLAFSPWGICCVNVILKDVSAAVSVLLASSIMYFVQHIRLGRNTRRMAALTSALLLFYACNVRHFNFILFIPLWVYFYCVFCTSIIHTIRFLYARIAVIVGVACLSSVGSFMIYTWVVDRHILHTKHVFSSPQIPMFDIVGTHHFADGGAYIPQEILKNGQDLQSVRKQLDSAYIANPTDGDMLVSNNTFFNYDTHFMHIWLHSILSHPVSYARHRLYFAWALLRFKQWGFPNYASYNKWEWASVPRGGFLSLLQNNPSFGKTMREKYPQILEAQADKMYLETVFSGNVITHFILYYLSVSNRLGLFIPLIPFVFFVGVMVYGLRYRHLLSLCIGTTLIGYIIFFCVLSPVISQMRYVYIAYIMALFYVLTMLFEKNKKSIRCKTKNEFYFNLKDDL